jgi:predicted nucleic acid-binding protein
VIAYIDSSAVLRPILNEPAGQPLSGLDVTRIFTSELTVLECLRVLDRLRLTGEYDDEQVATALKPLRQAEETFSQIPINSHALELAAQPFGTVVRTLDAIHLAVAIQLRAAAPREEVGFMTDDRQQGRAASGLRFRVLGSGPVARS